MFSIINITKRKQLNNSNHRKMHHLELLPVLLATRHLPHLQVDRLLLQTVGIML